MLGIPGGPGRMRVKMKEEEAERRRRRSGRNTKWFAAEGSLVGPEAAGVGLGRPQASLRGRRERL